MANNPQDRGESITLMEPMLISLHSLSRTELLDMAMTLASESAKLAHSLPKHIVPKLAELIKSMNCYYSNLIEGHNTHPIDIERALNNQYSDDKQKRDLQLEAKAYISAQDWIKNNFHDQSIISLKCISEIHKHFYQRLPEDLCWVVDPQHNTKEKVIPGGFRSHDVEVGQHIAISPGAVPRFLQRVQEVFGKLGNTQLLLASGALHHRLLWIHPFLDGNGRVVRLISDAIFQQTLDTGGLWSVSRGLARNVSQYKSHLMTCDQSRQGDLDGRGNLSEKALIEFSHFFLETALDQIKFMSGLFEPKRLRIRILRWIKEEIEMGALHEKSDNIIEALLYKGELSRAEIADILDVSDRQARRVTSVLLERKILTSENNRAPLHLNFTAELASFWMPGLFPDK